MRAGLSILVVTVTGCTATTVSRSMVAALPPLPVAQLAPDDWSSVWGAAQISPAHESTSGSSTGIKIPAGQGELGTLFMVAQRHLLLGVSFHGGSSDWARESAPGQLAVRGRLFMGGRARVGFRFDFEKRFGLMGSVEPGFDLLPWDTSFSSGGYLAVLPAISGSVTPYFDNGRIRLFVGLSTATMPAMTATVLVPAGCIGCEAPSWSYSGFIAAVGGVKVNVTESFAISAAFTAPLNKGNPPLLPMFSVSLLYLQKREPVEPEPNPEVQPEVPVPPPYELRGPDDDVIPAL